MVVVVVAVVAIACLPYVFVRILEAYFVGLRSICVCVLLGGLLLLPCMVPAAVAQHTLCFSFTYGTELFERSEFLIATCKKKKTDRLCVCPDVRLILVLVLDRQIVYGQNTVYLCLSKYIVFENTQQ